MSHVLFMCTYSINTSSVFIQFGNHQVLTRDAICHDM